MPTPAEEITAAFAEDESLGVTQLGASMNVVVTTRASRPIPLHVLHSQREMASNRHKFPAGIHHMSIPTGDPNFPGRAAALIFTNGKIVLVGARTIEHARAAMRVLTSYLDDASQANGNGPVTLEMFVPQNIVVKYNLPFRVDLSALEVAYGNAHFVPSTFPTVEIDVDADGKGGKVILVGEGGMTVVGQSKRSIANRMYQKVYEMAEAFATTRVLPKDQRHEDTIFHTERRRNVPVMKDMTVTGEAGDRIVDMLVTTAGDKEIDGLDLLDAVIEAKATTKKKKRKPEGDPTLSPEKSGESAELEFEPREPPTKKKKRKRRETSPEIVYVQSTTAASVPRARARA